MSNVLIKIENIKDSEELKCQQTPDASFFRIRAFSFQDSNVRMFSLLKVKTETQAYFSSQSESIRTLESCNEKALMRKNRHPVLVDILICSLFFQSGLYFSDL